MASSICYNPIFASRSSYGDTVLHVACEQKAVSKVAELVEELVKDENKEISRAFILTQNGRGLSAMDLVAHDPSPEGKEIYRLLNEVLSKPPSSSTSLPHKTKACASSPKSTSTLSSSGFRLVALYMAMPKIFQALIIQDHEALSSRIALGDNVNQLHEGKTPLIIAIHKHDYEAVKRLLKAPKININITDSTGQRPIDIAIEEGDTAIIELILDAMV